MGKNECNGQIEITDFLKSKIVSGKVMDLTSWINSQGNAQYRQVKHLICQKCEQYGINTNKEQIDRLTNAVSIYILEQSSGYMDYLKECSRV